MLNNRSIKTGVLKTVSMRCLRSKAVKLGSTYALKVNPHRAPTPPKRLHAMRSAMRSAILALALVALASAAPRPDDAALASDRRLAEEEPVRCDVGTYYWGRYFSKAYCVKCPKDTTSAGCVNCAEDKKHARCNCNVKLTSILTCGRSKYM